MNTTAAIFFLVLGQADGSAGVGTSGGGLAVIPSHYSGNTTEEALASCEDAGEAARANNLGLSYLSYTCVPGSINVEVPKQQFKLRSAETNSELKALAKPCDAVCELIEAAE
jgi:hypothetical protein